jgi:hypothetical protein
VDWSRSFFNAKRRRRVSGFGATSPIALKKHRRTRLPSPWERLEGLVVCWNLFWMQITRRWKTRFDEAVRRVTPYIEKL